MTVFQVKVDGKLHPSSTTTSSESKIISRLVMVIFSDSDERSSPATVKLLSHYASINFFYSTHFPFFFFWLLYLSTRFICLLTCLSLFEFLWFLRNFRWGRPDTSNNKVVRSSCQRTIRIWPFPKIYTHLRNWRIYLPVT